MDNSLNPSVPVAPASQQLLPLLETSLRQSGESPSSSPADKGNPKLVVVIGMHRSGTSAITRGLKALDVELGDRLWPPNEAVNAKGFWEDMDINALNIEMMRALNTDWHYLSPIEEPEIEILKRNGFLQRAAALLREKFGDSARFGFKDPRVAKLLPFWREVVSHCQFEGNYLIMTRHPLSVVESLRRREGFDAEKSYLLWLVHMLECLSATNGCRRVLVDFDRLMQSPERELTRIGSAFALTVDADGMTTYKSDFLDETLRHTTFDSKHLAADIACLPLVRDIYETLLSVAADELLLEGNDFQRRLTQWQDEFGRLQPALRLADKLVARNISVNLAIADKDRALHELGKHATSLATEIAAREEVGGARETILAEREEQIAGMGQELTLREGEISNLHQALTNHVSQIATLDHAMIERDNVSRNEQIGLEAIIFSTRQENTNLRQALAEKHQSLARIQESLSWRILAPVRSLWACVALRSVQRDATESGVAGATEMKISSSPATVASNYQALMEYQGRQFIQAAYLTLLKREPDTEGMNFYLDRLQTGAGKLQILHEIFSSTECRQAGVELPGLREALSRATANSKQRA